MEKGINSWIKESFDLPNQDLRTYSPLVLAYVGDAVYEMIVRSCVAARGNISPNHMNNIARGYVRAQSQSMMIGHLEELLTEQEADVFRRGKNAKPHTVAKNASVADYHRATGFEALIGYLYLDGQDERLMELVHEAMTWFDANRPAPTKKKES